MKFDDFNFVVKSVSEGFQIRHDEVQRCTQILSKINSELTLIYSDEALLLLTLNNLLTDLSNFQEQLLKNNTPKHLDCSHANLKTSIMQTEEESIKIISCEDCGVILFPKYVPGKIIPKIVDKSKLKKVGSLAVSDQIKGSLPKLAKSMPIGMKYRVVEGELVVQDGSSLESSHKEKSKRIDIKPGQRKIKFD